MLLFRSRCVFTLHVGATDWDSLAGSVSNGLTHKRGALDDSGHVSFGSTPKAEGVRGRQYRDAQILYKLKES